MPDKRLHRGPHPEDKINFGNPALSQLNSAVTDLSWMLSRGYADNSSLKLVGDRYNLTERQRVGVRRCACSDLQLQKRCERRFGYKSLGALRLLLDGFNVLTTVEAALGGGVILIGRDGCCRDMASMHGSFKKVSETPDAIRYVGQTLEKLGAGEVIWYLDQPVSNSGRLKQLVISVAAEHRWNWDVELVPDPDVVLAQSDDLIASADSGILDRCGSWLNLACKVVGDHAPDAWYVRLNGSDSESAV